MKYFQKKLNTLRRMTGYSDLKGNASYIKQCAQEMWAEKGQKPAGEGCSIESLHLSEKQIYETKRSWQRLLVVFLTCAGIALLYGVFSVIHASYSSALISVALLLLFLAQSFKYHFWLFQLKKGKLGCTWQEWLHESFKKKI